MIAPMNDCRLSVVPVSEQQQRDADEHRRHRGHGDECQPSRLEIRRQQQEDDDPGMSSPPARPENQLPARLPRRVERQRPNISRIGATWPRTST